MDCDGGDADGAAGRDAVGPADRRPLPRPAGQAPQQVLAWLAEPSAAPAHFLELVEQAGTLDREEQGLVFGESLPKGLRIL